MLPCLVPFWPQDMQLRILFRSSSDLVLDADHALDFLLISLFRRVSRFIVRAPPSMVLKDAWSQITRRKVVGKRVPRLGAKTRVVLRILPCSGLGLRSQTWSQIARQRARLRHMRGII